MRYTIIIMASLFSACFYKKPEKTGLEGKPLPSFALQLTDSSQYFDMQNVPSGKPCVVFLFSPHCPYSKLQMKQIVDNINELNKIHFYVITPLSYKDMKEFSDQYRLQTFNNITLGRDTANFYAQFTGAVFVPFISVYDKNKKMVRAFSGKTNVDVIREVAETNQ